jgi:hypothetical protein
MDEKPTPIRSLEGLSLRQHYQLLVDLLDFFATDLDQPNAKPIRELIRDPRFAGFTRRLLRDVIRALVVAGLLIRPPQLRARASRFAGSWRL